MATQYFKFTQIALMIINGSLVKSSFINSTLCSTSIPWKLGSSNKGDRKESLLNLQPHHLQLHLQHPLHINYQGKFSFTPVSLLWFWMVCIYVWDNLKIKSNYKLHMLKWVSKERASMSILQFEYVDKKKINNLKWL